MNYPDSALVLFSGGQDSTVCLAWALERFARVETVGFRLQASATRSRLMCAPRLRRENCRAALRVGARLGDDHVVSSSTRWPRFRKPRSLATWRLKSPTSGLPNTFVPGRNLMFFPSPARWPTGAARAPRRRHVRDRLFRLSRLPRRHHPGDAVALALGLDQRVVIHTPLMWVDKAATFAGGGDRRRAVLDLVIEETHSCYLGDRSNRHDWGYGCGTLSGVPAAGRGFCQVFQEPKNVMIDNANGKRRRRHFSGRSA